MAIDRCAHGLLLTDECFACAKRAHLERAYATSAPTDANAKQVGGDHYKGTEYQHWDFVTDIDLPYLPAVAVKYVYRWRKKNGVEDLRKAVHYLEKCIERDILCSQNLEASKLVGRFMMSMPDVTDAHIVGLIVTNNFEIAIKEIGVLLSGFVEDSPDTN